MKLENGDYYTLQESTPADIEQILSIMEANGAKVWDQDRLRAPGAYALQYSNPDGHNAQLYVCREESWYRSMRKREVFLPKEEAPADGSKLDKLLAAFHAALTEYLA